MIDYVCVNEAPKELNKKEYIIKKPDFIKYIIRAKGRSRNKNITSLSDLRNIFIEIGSEYSENFSAYSHVNLSNFIGLPFKNDKELSEIIIKIIDQQLPAITDVLIENQIKKMPDSTERVYYVSKDLSNSGILNRHNIRMADEQKIKKDKKNTTKKDKQ